MRELLQRAEEQYRRREFAEAARQLRAGAETSDRDDATRLRKQATNIEAVASNFERAEQADGSDPAAALAAYRRALFVDRKFGDGAHASYIRAKLGKVAPQAAAAYMAQEKYEAAKMASDAAGNYGSGADPTVRRVRQALERKARDFYSQAYRLRQSDPTAARKLLRRILAIVSAESSWYAKASRALGSGSD